MGNQEGEKTQNLTQFIPSVSINMREGLEFALKKQGFQAEATIYLFNST